MKICGWGGVARPSRFRRSHTAGMKSKVYPTYKMKYRVANWAAYNQALVRRGDVTGRCCMNTRCGWGGVARTSRDPPQEPHSMDAVEGPSHVQDEVPRGELAGLQLDPRSTRRCDGVVILGSDRCLDARPVSGDVGRPVAACAAIAGRDPSVWPGASCGASTGGVRFGQGREAVLGCEILNRMIELGRPVSYRIGR